MKCVVPAAPLRVRIEPIMSIRGVFAIGCQLPLRSCALLAATSRIRHEAKGGLTTTSIWEHFSSLPLRSLPLATLACVSLVLLWISTLCFHGVYFSNFVLWSRNAFESSPAGNVLTPLFGQAFLNVADDGQYLFAGTCFLWRSFGVNTRAALKHLALLSISLFLLCLGFLLTLANTARTRLRVPSSAWNLRPTLISSAVGLFCWGGHLFHVCLPQQSMLAAGIDVTKLAPTLARCIYVREFVNTYDGAVSTELILFHHLSIGILCIGSSLVPPMRQRWTLTTYDSSLLTLAIASGSMGSLSIMLCFALLFAPSYGPIASAYATVWALFCHHFWVGILFLLAAASYLALFAVRARSTFALLFSHRDILLGHLTWVCTFLGTHSVGALIHNDSMEALARNYDTFSDTSIQVRPMLAMLVASPTFSSFSTGDFLVGHVECFCIHTTVLVLLKGLLLARSSRLVSDKGLLGFTYPCDGPGRGGTCQISPSDHGFLGAFWAYNTGSLGLFHFFWYAQALPWRQLDDWAVSATSINGWLRSLLWTQSAEVIQAYGTPFSLYSLVFFTGHFVWAFSLMFLFTGRGYWQELIESIVWAHLKLQLVPAIQPRALSITMGRTVGCGHYLIGGIGVSWAFSICRFVRDRKSVV